MASIWDKAKNGDYDVTPYYKQREYEFWFEEQEIAKYKANYTGSHENIDWQERQITKLYWERRKRLLNDAERDELNRWTRLSKMSRHVLVVLKIKSKICLNRLKEPYLSF
jgi:hypothetical protein